jgi:enoyl-CoA hydratase/carnithine racemase
LSSEDAVLYAVEDHIAVITLNRPEGRNSMTPDVLEGLRDAVARVRTDAEVRCVVLTGSGGSFCAGADFRAAAPVEVADGDAEAPYVAPHERFFETYSPFLSVADIEVPTIAAMQGHAIGGGLGLALVCDLRVANESARYGANFVKLGLHPGMATTYLLPRLLGEPRAVELLLTGRVVSGAEAASFGLVHYAVEKERVLGRARELALEIAAAAPLAVRWTKRSIYRGLSWEPRAAAESESHVQSRSAETDDAREGIRAMLSKREPVFRGR